MNKITKNKIVMYRAVLKVLEDHEASWNGVPAFHTAVQQYRDKMDVLDLLAAHQNEALLGVTDQKDLKKQEIADKGFIIASALKAFAVSENNIKLLDQVKISHSSLQNATIIVTLQLIDRILSKATSFSAQLVDYGIDQAQIDELASLRVNIKTEFGEPRLAIIARKTTTSDIKILVKDIDAILENRLSSLMATFRLSHPKFYKLYQNAKNVINFRTGKLRSAEGEIPIEPDEGNGE